ncbi:hypothetical protein HER10_EVM0000616 [Colletotrichum scovillei]|uniref:Uncharacterized protein n=1 Tax=Colletotrichum scovillei TaxID=1209932 RepID=A0A9P7R5Z8_9PEZI|nr:uncharacterized protein HER10_EVM0000616 [Colletotrichum scovillei]KAF4781584.1 hypothetical protein HER10_EVM0000616 [Colletotrichum scovillei]KAG7049868.1 hypothetical protein JMJ77_0012626 [Colletotrichum scovillei]KAG7068906.1 hypothetical protein JMJ76_0002586 [Colletotrichum scovillei]KAG7072859.1 hypothetical protein JMJ78_0013844 [Colletotrichum scovillei]
MAPHTEDSSSVAEYAERVFQHLEDNRPSDAPADFSDPRPEKSNAIQRSKTERIKAQLIQRNNDASVVSQSRSKSGKFRLQHTSSFGDGRVKELVANYEARSHRDEETGKESVRRKRVLAKDTDAATGSESEEDEKDWIKVVDADLE